MSTTQINGGTQVQNGTITNAKLVKAPISADGTQAATANIPFGGFKATGLADPTSAQDAATKNYVDNMASGLDAKGSVRAATTTTLPAYTYANGTSGVGATLTGSSNGALSAIDGVTLVASDRVLVKNESTGSRNGIYVVTQVGSGGTPYILTRATDFDAAGEIDGGFAFVEEGTTNGDTGWVCTNDGAVTIGTTALTFTQFSSSATITAGNGLTKSGSTISAVDDATGGANLAKSVNVSANGLAVKIDDSTIGELASSRLGVKTGGITANEIAANAVTSAKIAASVVGAGTGLTGGGGSQISVNFVNRETPTGTINGSNATFTLASTPKSGTEMVFLNGVLQDAGAGNDYTISAATITMLAAPATGDKIRVSYFI